ncbi:MAG TPA: hypothetical protein P5571_07185 [Candidatus Krumholzibacteria bacterium]|nr:hypothetical protein [Candidatus Krumholzibacteria bacterium]HRX51129.1 hypothetical protein [Candidatus Krumholzibacteria bacterium]
MSLWEDVKKNLVSLYGTAAEKTNELAKVGSRRYDIFGLSREIERQFSEIGSHVYTAAQEGRTDLTGDAVLEGLVAQVRKLEKDLEAKKREIETIKAEAKAAAAAGGAAAAGFAHDEPDEHEAAAGDMPPTRAVEDAEWSEMSDADEEDDDAWPRRPMDGVEAEADDEEDEPEERA